MTPRYDVERFGIKLWEPQACRCFTGNRPCNRKMLPRLKLIYEQTPDPKAVIVVGACGTSGGVFYDSYNEVGPVDKHIPVDVYVPVPGKAGSHHKRCFTSMVEVRKVKRLWC